GVGKDVYPEGVAVLCPVETMSDDFSMAISGIPSMVNDFTSGQFMETHYHTQFDNDDYYDEAVYRFHHELYGCLVMAFDRTAVAPLNFERLFLALKDSLDLDYSEKTGAGGERLKELTEEAARLGKAVYEQVRRINEKCRNQEQPWKYREQYRELEAVLMQLFKMEQDSFVRLDWHDEVCFPQEAVRRNLKLVRTAVECLENGHGRCALEAIYGIDNNRYAFQFDEEVFRHFTDYVMNQEAGRLQWGAGRIVHHENLFHLVQLLKGKLEEEDEDFTEELLILKRVEENQLACYLDDIEYMNHAIEKMIQKLKEITENESWKVTDCTE
ncbi:MAG: peptidase, partial [Hungatella sp.]